MPSPTETLALALQSHRAGQLDRAGALARQVVAAQPANFEALRLLSQIAHQQGNYRLSADLTQRALTVQPTSAPLHFQRAQALRLTDRLPEAAEAFAAAARLQPAWTEAHHQLGNVLKQQRRFADALEPLLAASRLEPENATILLNLGVVRLELGDAVAAVECFRRAVAIQFERPEAHNILGHALSTLGRLSEARASFAEALRLRADYAPAHDNLGRLLKIQGRATEAIASFRAAFAAQPLPGTLSNLLLALNAAPDVPPAEIFAAHRAWDEKFARPLSAAAVPPPAGSDFTPGRRLRIGYVSPDFSHHAVAYFFEPVLAAHDRARFEIFCYANVAAPDRVTARLRAQADHWRDIATLNDDRAAALVRADGIDVLVDLAGHTARHRLLLFARKPAPAQITWLGYPNTTGLSAIDHRVTDEVSDPRGATEAWHSEKLLRLPGPFSCYRPSPDAPEPGELPALAAGHVTFGCFNNFAKVTPATIAGWARLLRDVPGSRLLLKSRGLGDAETAAGIREAFVRAGVEASRIELNGEELSVAAHLGLYRGVDIALDTFPYNGTTTTCEALWMGVPVVARAGETHVSRVGASLLTHLGAADWIAATEDAYVERARTLASDLAALAGIRRGLRERMRASPLCDEAGFTRSLEAAYREAWIRRCATG